MQQLRELLKKDKVMVTFKKRDNSIREMKCTLRDDLIGIKTYSLAPSNGDLIVVWDLEKEAWRSFKIDSVIEYSLGD